MNYIFNIELYNDILLIMGIMAVVVFIFLHKIEAGYGVAYTKKWGPTINNKLGWILMEAPVFIAMLIIWWFSERRTEIVPIVMMLIFELHYFQRSFIFPLLIKGKGKMPLAIICMGITFNLINAYMIGGWLFHFSPTETLSLAWFATPKFIIGLIIFIIGMIINIHSDYIIRHLRGPGDTGHYIPKGGMFRYVTSANYFGEITEWVGFSILTWSPAGLMFALWTFANLAPRAGKLHQRYIREFGDEYRHLNRKKIIPFIY